MNIESVFALVIGNLAIILPLWLWSRSENRTDMRQLQDIQRQDRKDILELIRAIDTEMRDFHGRLLEIERNRSKVQS